jgi:hypothetical protein
MADPPAAMRPFELEASSMVARLALKSGDETGRRAAVFRVAIANAARGSAIGLGYRP